MGIGVFFCLLSIAMLEFIRIFKTDQAIKMLYLCLLYTSYESQKYIYSTEKSIRIYWIHFFGTEFEQVLTKLPLFQTGTMYIGVSNEIIKTFEKIIRYMQSNISYYNLMCCGFFFQILAQIENLIRINDIQNPVICKSVEKVISLILSLIHI